MATDVYFWWDQPSTAGQNIHLSDEPQPSGSYHRFPEAGDDEPVPPEPEDGNPVPPYYEEGVDHSYSDFPPPADPPEGHGEEEGGEGEGGEGEEEAEAGEEEGEHY